jgi:CTP:molybdopterin cytidylyltransferase MocA
VPKIFLTPQACTELKALPAFEREHTHLALQQLASGAITGFKLWGHGEIYAFETPWGAHLLYRRSGDVLQLLVIETGRSPSLPIRHLKLAAVVLAGGQDEYTASIPLSTLADSFLNAGIDDVVMVVGRAYDSVRRELGNKDITLVANPEFDDCLSRSLRRGLMMLAPDTRAVFLSLGNRPFVTSDTVTQVIRAFKTHDTPIIVPAHDRMRGHPVLFDTCLLPELMQARGACGGRAVLAHHNKELTQIELADTGVLERVWTN